MISTKIIEKTDQPCWCGEGKSSCAIYKTPELHLHCFKCGKGLWDKKKVEEYLSMSAAEHLINGSSTLTKNVSKLPLPSHGLQKGDIAALPDRVISLETAEKFKVETLYGDEDEIVARIFPFPNEQGDIVAQKIKKIDKSMTIVGRWTESVLFGQNIFPAGGKFITVTEGEEDAMAAYEMLKAKSGNYFEPAVVSIRNGATGAKKDCQTNWEYLNSFDTIVVCFDMDKPGQTAAVEVANLFPNKVKIMRMDVKDANEYIKQRRHQDFMNSWRAAEKHTPEGIIPSSKLWGEMVSKDNYHQVNLPWEGLQKKLGGLRTGELMVIKAPPKVGKTQVMRELSYSTYLQGEKVGLIYLEETLKRIGLGLCALEMNKPLQFPETTYSEEELRVAHEKVLEGDNFFIFDPRAERTAENVFAKIKHFALAYECRYIFLDHVSMLAYDSIDADERKFLDKLFKDIKDLTASLNIHICAVTHVNDEGKTRGSRAAYQLCDALIDLSRDKLNDDPVISNTVTITVEENRLTGDSGKACDLYFNRETGRLNEIDLSLSFEEIKKEKLKEVKFDD